MFQHQKLGPRKLQLDRSTSEEERERDEATTENEVEIPSISTAPQVPSQIEVPPHDETSDGELSVPEGAHSDDDDPSTQDDSFPESSSIGSRRPRRFLRNQRRRNSHSSGRSTASSRSTQSQRSGRPRRSNRLKNLPRKDYRGLWANLQGLDPTKGRSYHGRKCKVNYEAFNQQFLTALKWVETTEAMRSSQFGKVWKACMAEKDHDNETIE